MRFLVRPLSSFIAFALLSSLAWAHHSTALYDFAQNKTLVGVVKSFQWANPHNYVQVLVTDDKGGQVEWAVEVGTPVTATLMGWTKNSFKAGDHVTLVVAPMRNGTPNGTVKTATLADGTKLSSVAADVKATSPFDKIPSLQRATPK